MILLSRTHIWNIAFYYNVAAISKVERCIPDDNTLWAPYKGLFHVIYTAVAQKDASAVQDLEAALKRHKPDLICLLRNPPRSPIHREAVKHAATTGIQVVGRPGLQILPQSLIDESLIISDMFDLNELTSLELLVAGQHQQPRFPGLTRGLVAMLLYYDGRRNLVNALQLLVQAREGRTWTLGVGSELSSIIMRFTNQLKEEGVIMKVIDLIEKTDVTKELELLHRNRALGGPRYRKQEPQRSAILRKACQKHVLLPTEDSWCPWCIGGYRYSNETSGLNVAKHQNQCFQDFLQLTRPNLNNVMTELHRLMVAHKGLERNQTFLDERIQSLHNRFSRARTDAESKFNDYIPENKLDRNDGYGK